MNITLSIIYLIATVTFVIGLKLLGHPETAKKGNLIAASGMGLAIIGTIFLHDFRSIKFSLCLNWYRHFSWGNYWMGHFCKGTHDKNARTCIII